MSEESRRRGAAAAFIFGAITARTQGPPPEVKEEEEKPVATVPRCTCGWKLPRRVKLRMREFRGTREEEKLWNLVDPLHPRHGVFVEVTCPQCGRVKEMKS